MHLNSCVLGYLNLETSIKYDRQQTLKKCSNEHYDQLAVIAGSLVLLAQ